MPSADGSNKKIIKALSYFFSNKFINLSANKRKHYKNGKLSSEDL